MWGNDMGLTSRITPHLPYLRRFARVLTGSQKAGDATVAAFLEAVIADTVSLGSASEFRVSLYRAFCSVWEGAFCSVWESAMHNFTHGLNEAIFKPRLNEAIEPPDTPIATAQQRLQTIPPRAREAFLLMAVEDFSPRQIADILGCDDEAVASPVDKAAKSIVDQVATPVLIIEDEPFTPTDN